jgi:hypothetical protein
MHYWGLSSSAAVVAPPSHLPGQPLPLPPAPCPQVPAGQDMMISVYNIHHSEAVWDNPEAFIPERFGPLDGPVPNEQNTDYKWVWPLPLLLLPPLPLLSCCCCVHYADWESICWGDQPSPADCYNIGLAAWLDGCMVCCPGAAALACCAAALTLPTSNLPPPPPRQVHPLQRRPPQVCG